MGGERTLTSRDASSSYPRHASGPVGKKIHNLYQDRLRQFLDRGQYSSSSLVSKLYEGRASGSPHIKLSCWSAPGQTRPTFKDATSQDFNPTKTGVAFGPSWSTHWFKVQLTLPSELRNANHLEFHWNSNSEAMIWSSKGEPLQGLTGGGEREEWIFPDSFRDGEEHVFYVEMACNGMFGNANGDSIQPPDPNRFFNFDKAEVVAVNLEARALWIDFWLIGDAAREFPDDSWEEHAALTVANEIMDCFIAGRGSKKCIKDCRKIAAKYIGSKVDSSDVFAESSDALISGIGNCHIDTCWLWPWAETKRKVARSWSSQCNLMERYPEYRFAVSQAQQYKWLEQNYPALFDRVKAKVKDGQFQPIGGSWVEHDTNLPSGESLVRQFVYGQRYFESRFGDRCKTFWLPDTFGYSSQLPQLCRLAGMTNFFTQKLSWNNINNFPHTTFNWVALDGSQVLCHMAPCETYTAEANFGDVRRSVTQHKSMDQDPSSLLPFGKGDGGGGPTWEHIEKLRRCRGIADTTGLLPRVKMGDSVEDFFAKLHKKQASGTKFTTWYGELYFELHRGTYTSQSNNKRNNRKAEIMLHDIEYLATLASLSEKDYQYPKKDIDDMWEGVLLCQFHDCLPGSCIEMCYRDSDELYEKIFKTGEKLLTDVMSAMGFSEPSTNSNTDNLVAINTLPWGRSDLISGPNSPASYIISAPTTGLATLQSLPTTHSPPVSITQTSPTTFHLSNSLCSIKVESGLIISLYDKHADREVIPSGAKANQYVIYDDKPLYWQAWDVEVFHLDSRQELTNGKSEIIEQNEYRVALLTETKISEESWIRTTISLSAAEISSSSAATKPLPYISITAEIEWHETQKFLKVEFPVDVLSSTASYETQFGIVQRPTHYNTSWDMAKFEVCCHKWADLSESGYGVSILNESKYGFATQGNVMRLSLLRAPKAPDAHADMGRHVVGWAVLPHKGPLGAGTVKAGREFNNPLQRLVPKTGGEGKGKTCLVRQPLFPFTKVMDYVRVHERPEYARKVLGAIRMADGSDPAIILDTVKRGEDDEDVRRDVVMRGGVGSTVMPVSRGKGEKSIVLRLYDSLGGRCRGRVLVGGKEEGGKDAGKGGKEVEWTVQSVYKCNLLEDDGDEVEVKDGGFKVELRPFEVASYRVVVA